MGRGKYIVEDVPKSMHLNKGVSRNKANVEAEAGETMVTRNDVTNDKQLVAIGGKSHAQGGTPLSVPEGTAIYSDKLKIKDPTVLKFFNESGKKEKTFAELSKKYDISTMKEKLDDPLVDKITKDSLTKSIDDATFKLSALFTMQEFHEKKGAPEQHSKHFEPFMERMRMSYEDILGTSKNESPQFAPIEKAHEGTETHTHRPGEGDDYPIEQRYKKEGVDRLNFFRKIYGLELIPESKIGDKTYIDKAAGEYRDAFVKNIALTVDYNLNRNNDPEKSDRPTNKMQRALLEKFKPANPAIGFTNAELQKLYDNGDIDDNFIVEGFNDDLWTYRAAYTNVVDVTPDEMKTLKPLLEKEGIKEADGNIYLWKGNDLYEAYRTNADGTITKVEPDPEIVDKLHKWNYKPMDEASVANQNPDFRWDHRRALAQARKNKNNIPRLAPFSVVPETSFVDQAYYNPDQALAAVQSMVSNMGTKQAMFAPQQGQTANFLAGQQFDVIARTIGDYEDKNVNAYNQESLTNTQIANQASERLARSIEGHHDKTTILQQEYANARKNVDNNIAENEIAMWRERANRVNLENTIGEQYRTDPNTGFHKFVKGKDYYPNEDKSKDMAATWQDLREKIPSASDADITRMVVTMHGGKYEVQKDESIPPNESQYKY